MRIKLLLFLSLMALAISPAWPATLCGTDGQDLFNASGYSCSIGPVTFSNFSLFSTIGFVGTSPHLYAGSASNFDGQTAFLELQTTSFNAQQSDKDAIFIFQVTGQIGALDADLGVFSGSPFIVERACAVAFSGATCPEGNTLASFTVDEGTPSRVVKLANAPSSFWVSKDIAVPQGSSISDFTQSFETPEPITLTLIGTGLCVLGLLRRRYPKR